MAKLGTIVMEIGNNVFSPETNVIRVTMTLEHTIYAVGDTAETGIRMSVAVTRFTDRGVFNSEPDVTIYKMRQEQQAYADFLNMIGALSISGFQVNNSGTNLGSVMDMPQFKQVWAILSKPVLTNMPK